MISDGPIKTGREVAVELVNCNVTLSVSSGNCGNIEVHTGNIISYAIEYVEGMCDGYKGLSDRAKDVFQDQMRYDMLEMVQEAIQDYIGHVKFQYVVNKIMEQFR